MVFLISRNAYQELNLILVESEESAELGDSGSLEPFGFIGAMGLRKGVILKWKKRNQGNALAFKFGLFVKTLIKLQDIHTTEAF